MLRLLIWTLLISFCSHLNADSDSCLSRSHTTYRDFDDFHNYIHQVVDYYEGSPRRLVETMSSADQDRYAATGSFHCDGKHMGSAQLTVKSDIITVSGHQLVDGATCTKKHEASACYFETKYRGKILQVPVEQKLASGFVCPPPNGKLPLKNYRDWAVLKLKFPVPYVLPYQIDADKVRNFREGDQVITIGHSTDFHAKYVNNDWVLPKHYGTCPVMNVDRQAEPYFIASACGCSAACSGGTLLSDDNKRTLMGITVGNLETKEQTDREVRTGPDKVKWNLDSASTFYVPLTGDFLRAVEDATGSGSI